MTKEQERLWQEMADLTREKCQATCHDMGSCCSTMYCEMAADLMRKAGHEFPLMPFGKTFVVDGKCIVPPQFRPLCTLQQCKISGMGCDAQDLEWTNRYFELRERLSEMAFEEGSFCSEGTLQ